MILWMAASVARPEEIWLYDNARVYGLLQGVEPGENLRVLLPTGLTRSIALKNVVSIRFLGRRPLLVQTGTQEFRFVQGSRLRGQILSNQGDRINVSTAVAGTIDLNMAHLKGFVALPMSGFIGRKAEELVESDALSSSPYVDTVLDRRGGTYPGVVKGCQRTQLEFDVDDLLQVKRFPIHYVKAVRLADAGRDRHIPWRGDVQVFLMLRDGSVVRGTLVRIHLGRWTIHPAWNPAEAIQVTRDEIALVQTLGGRVQYLSQLTPVEVRERTALAPPQPFRMDRSASGDAIVIAGKRYPWGIGVHANADLTFDLKGRYQEFRADVGLDGRVGTHGSVRFFVLGDGKQLAASPVVRGPQEKPLTIAADVTGVRRLTLRVTDAGDLDLGDAANWGSARVLREPPPEGEGP